MHHSKAATNRNERHITFCNSSNDIKVIKFEPCLSTQIDVNTVEGCDISSRSGIHRDYYMVNLKKDPHTSKSNFQLIETGNLNFHWRLRLPLLILRQLQ